MDQLDMTVEQNDDLSEEIRQAEAQIEAGNGIDHKEAKRQVWGVLGRKTTASDHPRQRSNNRRNY